MNIVPATSLLYHLPLLLGVLVGTEVLWSLGDPGAVATWLERSAGLLIAVLLASAVYSFGLPRLLSQAGAWQQAASRLGPLLALGGTGLMLGLLAQEFAWYDPAVRHTPLPLGLTLGVAAAVTMLLATSLSFALARTADPFGLADQRRPLYVYAAEALLAVLLIHLRLNVPDWFPPLLGKYWPLFVMAVAFLGVGLSEWFARRGLPVLSEPLQRTALFLPLLPVLSFLVRPLTGLWSSLSQAVPGLQPLLRYLDRLPEHYGQHAGIWLLLGLLYAWLAVLRRSSLFGLLAALAANFAAWVVFANHEGLAFLVHPQVWLIPVGLIVLAAEFLNRDQLPPAQSQALRYAGLLLIYVSSSADMFIAGLGESVFLPILLAVLSITGVLAGILLRVRSFLFLGVSFLALVILAQIWHAAVDRAQTWVWWASGIVLGVAILTLFALFEKHRNEVKRLVEDLKGWE